MFPKHITGFLICCWVVVISICCMLLFMAFRQSPTENKTFVCGNALMGHPENRLKDSTFAHGKAVFQINCASCHNPVKDATGPALVDISSIRSQEWICIFLTQPKFIPNDERAYTLRKIYGLRCMKFPQLSCAEVQAAVTFIDYYKR